MVAMNVTLASGEQMTLNLSGGGMERKWDLASFELVLCNRDKLGNKVGGKRSVYRGDNPKAVEATFLKGMSKQEKKKDLYAV